MQLTNHPTKTILTQKCTQAHSRPLFKRFLATWNSDVLRKAKALGMLSSTLDRREPRVTVLLSMSFTDFSGTQERQDV